MRSCPWTPLPATSVPGEGGTLLQLGCCPGPALTRPGPLLSRLRPPAGPALTPPVTEPRPSERPSPNPASAAQGCAPAPPTEGQPHPHPVIGQPGPWQEPIGCSVCPFPAAPRPRARAFLRGHVAARGAPPSSLSPTPRPAAHARAGGAGRAQVPSPRASGCSDRGRGRGTLHPQSVRPFRPRGGLASVAFPAGQKVSCAQARQVLGIWNCTDFTHF